MERFGTPTPVYVAWPAVARLIGRFSETGIPTRVDFSYLRSALPRECASPSRARRFESALRFLGLIAADGTTTPRLVELVQRWQTTERPKAVEQMLRTAYARVLGEFDLAHETSMALDRAFELYGVRSEQVREKCRRFLLAGLRGAGVALSENFFIRGVGRVASNSPQPSSERRPQRSMPMERSGESLALDGERAIATGASAVSVPQNLAGSGDTIVEFRGLRLSVPAGFRLSAIERAFLTSVLDGMATHSATEPARNRRR